MNAYILAALPPALLLIAKPDLWAWALAVAALVALAALGAAAGHFRGQRDEARENVARLEAECNAHAAENARLARSEAICRDQNERMRAVLTEAALTDPTTATTVPVPLLRPGKGVLSVVPPVSEDDYWVRLYDEKGHHRD